MSRSMAEEPMLQVLGIASQGDIFSKHEWNIEELTRIRDNVESASGPSLQPALLLLPIHRLQEFEPCRMLPTS